MLWIRSWQADPEAREIADRHYSRKKPGSAQFTPPGRKLVLKSVDLRAYWVTSYPYAQYVQHAWAGAFVCSAFRNEGRYLSSTLIRDALACTRDVWPDVPDLGMITFVDEGKVRRKAHPGYCYRMAGFKPVGYTKTRGLLALQLLPADFPLAEPPLLDEGFF